MATLVHYKARMIALFIVLTLIVALSFSFRSSHTKQASWLTESMRDFELATEKLNQTSNDFRVGLTMLDSMKAAYLHTRYCYKRIEFIVEYYYPSFVEDHINGAPLLHIERHDTRPFVVVPEGLQVLDELIFADSSALEKPEIANACQQLLNQTRLLISGMQSLEIKDHDKIEAIRQELVRLFTMGVTGFDTPGSGNALEDAKTVVVSLKEAAQPLMKAADPQFVVTLNTIFDEALTFLEKPVSFDDFDRLSFLKAYVNPLYEELHHLKNQIAPNQKTTSYSALNPEGENIFSDDFLNPYFFTQLKKEEDSDQLRALGKKLFFDPLLSQDGKMSCASCHNPALAFSDGLPKSQSNVVGTAVMRNAPVLMNAVYADRYFYDVRAFTLEQQAEHVIFNSQEFNTAYEEIVSKLNADKSYKKLFKKALGTTTITQENFSAALASFVLSLRSFNSPFDRFVRGEVDTLNDAVSLGFNLFMGKAACATCHFAPTFSGLVPPRFAKNETEILGVFDNPQSWKKELDKDMGRWENGIYSEQAWIFERSFKTPTVRNVEVSAPYFHNGAYATLESVINFYDLGGGSGFGLEVKNQTLPPDPLNLSPEEKNALILFMKSLTDLGQ